MDIEVRSYRKPQEAQMTSTMVECLQGIQTAKEAAAPDENGSGNQKIRYEHFTRADDAIRDTLCAQMPYGGGIISYDIATNEGFGKRHMYERPRSSPRVTDWFGAVSEHLDE
jgi:hypothetical protein